MPRVFTHALVPLARFFSERGWRVLQSELLWVWLPTLGLALLIWLWRRRRSPDPNPSTT